MIAHDLFHFQKYKGRLLLLLGILVVLILVGNSVKKAIAAKRNKALYMENEGNF